MTAHPSNLEPMATAEHGGGSGEPTGLEVAVVGMAGRFPGADDIHAFWRNLRDGVESISSFTREEVLAAGFTAAVLDDPLFVRAGAPVRGADELDAGLFGMTPRDAEILNPQHRLFLECAWAALEHAGYDPARVERPVGVFAGSGVNSYLARLTARADLVRAVGQMRMQLSNDKDHLASGVAYRLNLRGPAVVVQTACSTALVAVHVACQSLINGECDLALAGGSAVAIPFRPGYLYSPDGIASPDGHCRAFDAQARGTVRGNGAGVVVLRRLEDALADGDTIHAVIRGSAINNDGAEKVGYTAPSVTGQARVIREALSVAGVDAGTVDYLEAHGTGTPLGDAIELKALGDVLARAGDGGHPLAIGSVKTNVGHLDTAAGVAGLIKTVLALGNREIPPSLHCAVPHPEIEVLGGRVFVNTALRPWERNGTPRRAGVSSFGIGGTNAHVVLEEAPAPAPPGPSRRCQLLVLSARTPTALAAAAGRLAAHLEAEAPPLADAAFTLQNGRAQMEHRLAVVCRDAAEGAARLREAAGRASPPVPRGARPAAFLFPGVGTQYVDMGRGLYRAEPAFRAAVDACCEILRPVLGSDLRDLLFSSADDAPGADEADPSSAAASDDAGAGEGGWDLRRLLGRRQDEPASPLDDTRVAQPAVFVVEYALAKLWESWGVRPAALAGHSLGEYVAACVAGVMTLDDALRLVAMRARLIGALPGGAMLAVPLGEAALRELLPPELDVAAVNTPESCVVSGPAAAVQAFEAALAERGTVSRRLPARHAFHSRAMEAAAGELEALVAGFELRAPRVRFVSNVTGTWITDDEARSPAYWARHLCRTVRFADCVATLRGEAGPAFLEVGPGQALGAWAVQHPAGGEPGAPAVFSSLRHRDNRVGDARFLLETLGGLWAAGVAVDWAAFSAGERRMRIPLPGYPFERQRYWVDPLPAQEAEAGAGAATATTGTQAVEHPAGEAGQKGPYEMEDRPAAAPTTEAAPLPREEALRGMLREIVSELTGRRGEQVRMDLDLYQAGLDSLLLLQAIQAVEKRVGVRVSLVELLEDIGTLDSLAAHLDRILPPGAFTPPPAAASSPAPAPAPAPPAAAGAQPRQVPVPPAFYPPAPALPAFPAGPADAAAGDGMLERLFAQQLQAMGQLMAQQIAAASGAAIPAASPFAGAPAAHASPAAAPAGGAFSGSAQASVAPEAAAFAAPAVEGAPAADEATDAPRVRRVEPAPRAPIQPDTFVPYRQVNPEGRGGLTPRQAEYLEGFIARFVEKTKASKAHQVRFHPSFADGRVSAAFRRAWKEILYPIVSTRALGSRIWDLDGNEYVDTGMSFGCNLFGHAPEFVSAAIRDQVERGYGVGPQSLHAGRAAELVCELGGNDRAVFCNSGTEAVMGAIRAARTFSGRNRIAVFAGSYHGWADVVLGRPTPTGILPTGPGVSPAPLQDVLMLKWDDPESLETLARHLDELALVMVEPVQSRRLDIQPHAFLHELRRMTREAGTLLLFDELITGFRIHPGGAQAYFGVRADLVTYGKVVAGGLPMGVVAGRREVMDVFDGGVFSYGDDSYPAAQRTFFAGAYFKHPLSMAVAVSILEEIRRRGPEMYERLNGRAEALVARLNAFFEAGGYPITTVRFGSAFRFFFARDFAANSDLFHHHLVLNGIYVIPETGTHFLSTAHTDDDLELFFRAVRLSAQALRGGGFIPDVPPAGAGGGAGPSSASAARNGGAAAAPRAPGGSPSADASGEEGMEDDAEADPGGPSADRLRGDGARVLPLSEGQRQLWVESQMGDDANRAYIESMSIRLTGALDVEALRGAVAGVVARHDTLRVTFGADGETQLVHPSMPAEVPLDDLRALPDGERAAALEAWTAATARPPFDLEAGPLFRFAVAAVGDGEHVLAFTFHHAVLDGRSVGVVLDDLGALYRARVEGRPAALAPRPDHGAMVRAQTGAVRADAAAQAYWEAQLAGGIPVLELPTDRPRPPFRDYAGGCVSRTASFDLMRRLAGAGRGHGLTMFNTLLAAVFAWLERVTGEDDLVVGTPAAGQVGVAGHAGLVGFDINVLPIRVRVSPAAPFAEHARRVRRAVAGAVEHQAFSFPRLVETLLKRRDPSRPPVFSVLMHLDRRPGPGDLGGLRAETETSFAGGSKVDLTFDLAETPEGLHLRLVYAAALFDRDTAGRWLASFERLLEAVAADPARRLAELPLAGDEERRLVVEEWNRTARPYPHACIHALFEAQAERTPGAPAVVCGGETLTYAELDARANRLAHHLRRRGVGPEDRVALCMERGPELMAAFFGILKAGAAYVPLEPTHPADRLAYMLEDSGARLLLTQSRLHDRLPAARPETLAVDALAEALAAEPAERPASGVLPENLAYVYYTSGSTGRPKGVAMHHYGPANYFAWGRGAYRPAGGRGAPVFSSMAVDLTLANFIPLFAGERVELLPEGPGVEPLADAVRAAPGYGMIKITPTHLSLLNQLLTPEEAAASTATLVIGADNLFAEPTLPWQAGAPGVRLLNEYGPTETVVGCSLYEIPPGRHAAGRVPIGRPIDNLTMYVLDGAMHPVPPALPGELYIGGVGVARGYLGRPALTAEKFVPDPFSATAGARLYRTGDRARFLADGNLEFLGRTDFQVKVRGYRIEIGEIESVLSAHPAVAATVVVAREDAPGDRRIVAYAVLRAPGAATAEALREALRETLPEYMIPAAIVVMESLPTGATGKVDRKALPAPDYAAPAERHVAPRTPAEETLAAVWAEVLRLERVGVHDNFFELGGESILAIQMVTRARRRGVEVTPRQVFQYQTIAELASVAERGGAAPAPVEQGRVTGAVPLLPIQAWHLEQGQPAPGHYNQSFLFALAPSVSDAALQTALHAVLEHHDALRLRFRRAGGGWEQWHAAETGIALERVDLSGLDPAGQERAQEAAADARQASLDLERGPVGRAVLFDRGPRGRVLLLALHHLVVDGVSWRILRDDLDEACARASAGEPIDLGPKTTSFREWAHALAAYASSEAAGREAAHWLAQGTDGVAPLPADGAGGGTEAGARTITVSLEPDETRALLQEVPAAYRTQVNDVLLFALCEAVSGWTGGTRVRLALEGHGREEEAAPGTDLTRTVGWFTTVYPVVLDLAGAAGPGERLMRVKEQLRAVPARGIGYGALRWLGPDAGLRGALAAHPDPEIVFNYLGQFDGGAAAGGEPRVRFAGGPRGRETAGANRRRAPLEVVGSVHGGRLRMSWSYGEGTHRAETVERLAAAYLASLRALVAHCAKEGAGGCTPSDFPLAGLTRAELEEVVGDGRGVEDLYPLTPMQEGMLFHALAEGEAQAYHVQIVKRLEGDLDVELFRRAWDEVVARHPVLRTSFAWRGAPRPLQKVHARVEVPWTVEDWRGEADPDAALRRVMAEDRARGFDLERAPLLRFFLLQLADGARLLLWSQQHLLADGWACHRIFAEVMEVYRAWRAGRAPEPRRARPYRDHIAWLERRDPAEAQRYWTGVLAGFRVPTPLPGALPAAPGAPSRPAQHRIVLDAARTRRLSDAARRMQVTLNTLLQGAWGLVLARHSGEDDVVFGTTVSGRPAELEGVEEMVGLFINTLPARVKVPGDARVGAWLGELQRSQAEAREHEYTSLVRVQGWSEVPRGTPLFETHFIFENFPTVPGAAGGGEGGGRTLRVREGPMVDWNTYPLSLMADPGRELVLSLTYDRGRVDTDAAARLLRHFDRVLDQLAADAGLALSEVTLLDDEERRTVVEEWNRTAVELPAEGCIHRLFEAQAARTPDAPAVVFGAESLAYRALDERANRIAHRLRRLGVGPEVRVGLCLERGIEMMPAILGVMKAGGAYVPVDPAHPAERNGYVLADSGAAVLLTQARLADRLPVADGVRVVLVDTEEEAAIAVEPAEAPESGVTPENLCYVIYTSGSTGRPKGVAMHHRGVVNYIDWGIGFYGAERGNGSPVFSSMAVDLTITNLLPLFAGKPVVFLPEENAVEALAEALRARPGFGAIKITPVHLSLLTPLLSVEEAREAAHTLVVGADFLPAEPTVFWQDHAPGVRLMNEYGPTETVVGCSAYVLPNGVHRAGPVPVGGPIQNLRFYVLDAAMRPVPVGVPGELYIGGVGVARGYLGRPSLSAEKFVPDPFAGPGARMYRSGDRARWLEGGNLMVLGRADNQVKIRGYRVELGEVEAVLRRHEAVTGALAVVREDLPGDWRLVAYVAAGEGAVDAAALREHLRRSLPEHMVPVAFVLLPSLPNTATGKIDPRTLPAPEYGTAGESYVAPRTPVEEVLAEIWGEVLGVERVGAADDFFALGGHSLLAMRLLARVHARFGLRLSIRAVFSARTLEAMAAEVERLAWEKVSAMPESEAEAAALAALAPAEEG
jgi:amino acid adenylation domain-containing protein/non-ribosomal peptide synthase protein (TIGR01720 family)